MLGQSPGGIRDGAIETDESLAAQKSLTTGHPAGFAMARLKRQNANQRVVFANWSPGGIRDGAIET